MPSCEKGRFQISIHAPSRERLRLSPPSTGAMLFQSTLPRGSDRNQILLLFLNSIFQSTLPRGSDMENLLNYAWQKQISIHAPSRERQIRWFWFSRASCISIHAPSRERQSFLSRTFFTFLFQSTLPRGSDRVMPQLWLPRTYFNPRSLAGATQSNLACLQHLNISIHAPSRERH